MSGLVAKNWPNLIKVVPISWRALHSLAPADKLLLFFLSPKLKPITEKSILIIMGGS